MFDMNISPLRPEGSTSDAAGLNGFPGVLRYDEVLTGEIPHALRVSIYNSQNAHIWPARHHAGINNTSYPKMGQRFRLKTAF